MFPLRAGPPIEALPACRTLSFPILAHVFLLSRYLCQRFQWPGFGLWQTVQLPLQLLYGKVYSTVMAICCWKDLRKPSVPAVRAKYPAFAPGILVLPKASL